MRKLAITMRGEDGRNHEWDFKVVEQSNGWGPLFRPKQKITVTRDGQALSGHVSTKDQQQATEAWRRLNDHKFPNKGKSYDTFQKVKEFREANDKWYKRRPKYVTDWTNGPRAGLADNREVKTNPVKFRSADGRVNTYELKVDSVEKPNWFNRWSGFGRQNNTVHGTLLRNGKPVTVDDKFVQEDIDDVQRIFQKELNVGQEGSMLGLDAYDPKKHRSWNPFKKETIKGAYEVELADADAIRKTRNAKTNAENMEARYADAFSRPNSPYYTIEQRQEFGKPVYYRKEHKTPVMYDRQEDRSLFERLNPWAKPAIDKTPAGVQRYYWSK